jgi:hypothetical protein
MMRWKDRHESFQAPAAPGGSALKWPGRSPFPRVDDHLVAPETREEMVRGERILAQPALAGSCGRRLSPSSPCWPVGASTDLAELRRWHTLAISAASADEVLAESSPAQT